MGCLCPFHTRESGGFLSDFAMVFFACQTRIRWAGLLVRCARESALIGRNLGGLLLYILWSVERVDGGEVAPDDVVDAVNELCFDC